MELSARNVLAGKVVSVKTGAVMAEVVVALPGGQEIVSEISVASVKRLKLKKGADVCAIVKASSVMIGK